MITTKYLWCLHVLQNLERYREKDLQESVEYLWTILFADYVKCDRSVLGMPHSWQPDIVAYNRKENVWLLVELKGKPPHGNQSEAVTQVCAYAFQLLEEHPSLLLKLLLIGPWEKKYYYQYKDNDPFHVAVVNVPNLGAKIEELFESMLC